VDDVADLVVAKENYSGPVVLTGVGVEAVRKLFDYTCLMDAGWSLSSAKQCQLSVTFVDGAEYSPPLPQIIGLGRAERMDPVAQTSLSAYWLVFVRNQETLDVEVADVSGSLARPWVTAIQAQHDLISLPNGIGVASGPGAALDTGNSLIRITWSDGESMGDSADEVARRAALHVAKANEILNLIGGAAGP
jgi:hypothetical protein